MNPIANRGAHDASKMRVCYLTIAAFLLLIYPFLGMIFYHEYPIISVEVITVILICVVLASVFAMILSGTRPFVSNLALVLLVTVAFLIHFNLFFVGFMATLSAALLLSAVFRARFPELVAFMLVAMIFGSWLDNQFNPAMKLTSLEPGSSLGSNGPIVHILMDGFIGPDGLPGSEESGNLREDVLAFFRSHDFELHSRAYSHYSSTLDSMTRALNFQNDSANLFQRTKVLRAKMALTENKWFRILQDSGYQLNVYQTESVDFCGARLSREINCNTFAMPNLRTIHRDVHPALKRISVMLNTLLNQSEILTKILKSKRLLDSWGVSVYDERMLQKLANDVALQPRSAFFAHVLVPHSPLIFREDCSIDYSSEIWKRWSASGGFLGNNEESRKIRYGRLVPQIRCAMNLLGDLFKALEDNGLYDSATIIVHGDHGSSAYIFPPVTENLDYSNQRDFLEVFSTLFAVKWPGGTARKIDDVKSLNTLMAETAVQLSENDAETLGIPVVLEEEPFVYLSGQEPLTRLFVNIFEKPGGSRTALNRKDLAEATE